MPIALDCKILAGRAATFTKFGKRLHEFQLLKRFHLQESSRLIISVMQIDKIGVIFPLHKNSLKNVPCANIVWFGVVIELISSNWKMIAK